MLKSSLFPTNPKNSCEKRIHIQIIKFFQFFLPFSKRKDKGKVCLKECGWGGAWFGNISGGKTEEDGGGEIGVNLITDQDNVVVKNI